MMAEKRQFEVLLVRLVPHALRDDFMTVGVAVMENSSQPAADSEQKGSCKRVDYRVSKFAAKTVSGVEGRCVV